MLDAVRRMEFRGKVEAQADAAEHMRDSVTDPVLKARFHLLALQIREIARVFLDQVDTRTDLQERSWLNGAEMALDIHASELANLTRLVERYGGDPQFT
jgi:hypothetical protein